MNANDEQVGGSHYKHTDIQHWDWSWYSKHDSFQYQITKYVDRHLRKNGLQDLRKAQHFLAKYIELLIQDGVYSSDTAMPGDGIIEREWEFGTDEYAGKIDELVQSLETGADPGRSYVDPDLILQGNAAGRIQHYRRSIINKKDGGS